MRIIDQDTTVGAWISNGGAGADTVRQMFHCSYMTSLSVLIGVNDKNYC